MEPDYNVYFRGELLPGQDGESVRANLARLFNAGGATLDKMFSGKLVLLKKGCDRATALKYQQAMERAGARAVIRESSPAAAAEAPAPTPPPQPAKKLTTAERIAAVAAGRDPYQSATEVPAQARQRPVAGDSDLTLAAEGTEVLLESERAAPQSPSVDSPALDIAAAGERLAPPAPAQPPAPATDHLSLAASGATIPNLPTASAPLAPDTSALGLAAQGTDFSDCARPAATEPVLDLTALALSPAGADVLAPEYRVHDATPAPSTDHIQLGPKT